MRIDYNLAFMLQFENIAWYENGIVKILDRRMYPMKTEYVVCRTYKEVIKALQDMVTQSGGPYLAASMGMVLAAYQTRDMSRDKALSFLEKASYEIAHARPTTSSRMESITNNAFSVANNNKWSTNDELIQLLMDAGIAEVTSRYERFDKIANFLAQKVPNNGTVMTQCFAETVVGMLCRNLKEMGKENVKFICPETRPYLQGARLTASVIKDMDFEVHVITDNMPGYILKEKNVDLFTSASDMITQDGYIVNKIGTFQIAVLCHYYNIPYFVTGIPSKMHKSIESVEIEERNQDEILEHLGTRVTMDGVKGFYPAFDITPPKFCSGVITEKGIYSPYNLTDYFND